MQLFLVQMLFFVFVFKNKYNYLLKKNEKSIVKIIKNSIFKEKIYYILVLILMIEKYSNQKFIQNNL